MIKVANNLKKLVLVKQAEEESNLGPIAGALSGALGGAGAYLAGRGLHIHKKHWMRDVDGNYIRRMSSLADRDNPRPTVYDPKGLPIYDYPGDIPSKERLRIDTPSDNINAKMVAGNPAQPGNPKTQQRLRIDVPPEAPRLRIDVPPEAPRLRIDASDIAKRVMRRR